MAPRGRPPKPTSRHKAEGTLRKDRHAARRTPPAVPDAIEPPEHLTEAEAAKFRDIVDECAGVGIILKRSDAYVVERAAVFYVIARSAGQLLAELGRYIEGQRGTTRHPAVMDQKAAWEAFDAAGAKLGLSPLDRERIKANEAPDEDPLDDLDANRGKLRSIDGGAARKKA